MGYKVDWLVEERVIFYDIFGEHDAQEAATAFAEVQHLFEAAEPPVHLITDTIDRVPTDHDPENADDMQALLQQPDFGSAINIVETDVVDYLNNIYQQYDLPVRAVETLADAKRHLRRVDDSLADAL